MLYAKQSSAITVIVGPILDSAGAEYTSAVIGDLSISKNGGTLTALASAATLTHIANGQYTLVFRTTDVDTLGRVQVFCNKSTYQMPSMELMVMPATVYDALITNAAGGANGLVLSLASNGVNVGQWLGTTVATPATAGIPDVNVKNIDNDAASASGTVTFPNATLASTTNITAGTITTATNVTTVNGLAANAITATSIASNAITSAKIATGAITSAQFAAGAINAAAIAADAITDAKVASDVTIASVTGSVGSVTGAVGSVGTGGITAASIAADAIGASELAADAVTEIAAGVWDRLTSALTTVGSAGKLLADNLNATVSSRASQTSLDTLDDYVDTEVAAIKAKTDQLTFTVANQVDSNALSGGGLDAAGVRSAIGLSSANLDTQLADIPTVAEFNARSLPSADYFIVSDYTAPPSAATNATAVRSELTTELGRIDAAVSTRSTPAQVATELATYDAPTKAELDAAFTEIKGATWSVSDTLEAIRDRGDAAWTTATGFSTLDAAGVRSAVGLASANLDTQLNTIDTVVDSILVDTAEIGVAGAGLTNINLPNQTMDIVGNITGNLSGSVGSVTGNVGGNVVGSVGSVTGLTVGNLDVAVSTLATAANLATVAGYIDTEVAAIKAKTDNLPANPAAVSDIPTANAIADQVWDEVLSGHLIAGSTGNALNAAGSSGDPWATTLPGAYGAGSAGKIIGDNLNATISSRASQSSLDTLDDYVDTEVAAIKAKTDQLTFTVANQVDSNALSGGGSGLDAAGVRAAIGLASANLDTQLADLPTVSEFNARTLPSDDYFVVSDYTAPANLDIAAIKSKTDNLPSDPADQSILAAAIAAIPTTTDPDNRLLDVWRRLGLDAANPLVNTADAITAGSVLEITVTQTSTSVTTTRQP